MKAFAMADADIGIRQLLVETDIVISHTKA